MGVTGILVFRRVLKWAFRRAPAALVLVFLLVGIDSLWVMMVVVVVSLIH